MSYLFIFTGFLLLFRSLVALSLILALLLFNPAPLYILDEVDAALDLSHTQNIGQMLKTHFRHSQVISSDIVVTLTTCMCARIYGIPMQLVIKELTLF